MSDRPNHRRDVRGRPLRQRLRDLAAQGWIKVRPPEHRYPIIFGKPDLGPQHCHDCRFNEARTIHPLAALVMGFPPDGHVVACTRDRSYAVTCWQLEQLWGPRMELVQADSPCPGWSPDQCAS